MAPPAGTLRVGRYFAALIAIIAVLYLIVFWPGSRHTPKLGLDLEGGQQVIFTASEQGGKSPSSSSMKEAQQILEARVNGTGVTEATVVIQGNNQLVVSIPGATGADIAKLGAAAQLSMRGLVMPIVPIAQPSTPSGNAPPTTSGSGSASGSPPPNTTTGSGSATSGAPASGTSTGGGTTSPAGIAALPAKAPSTPAASPPASPSPSPGGSSSAPTPTAPARTGNPLANLGFTIPTSDTAYAALDQSQQQLIQQALSTTDCALTNTQDNNAPYYVACDSTGTAAYLLGSTVVKGTEIASSNAVAPNAAQGQTAWTVGLTFKSSGDAAWAKYTAAHNVSQLGQVQPDPQSCSSSTVPCADFVAFTLDGKVISAPYNQQAINGGTTQITGQFTQSTANDLANQLKYGALPLSFTPQASQNVSPTLGTAQLKAGLLAGGIGLALVIIYSLIYYRGLGLVTIASLVVSGILTYGALVMLGTQIGFTLSLAGIAGFIVAVGITADSFVVFFERLKDEVRDGRSIRVAVPRAWVRARRTILSADTVSFLAAAILYYFAAGDVKGFAFTLGLSTILDLVVVFLFTHPLVSLLSRSRAFGSARFTGLDSLRGTPVADPEPALVGRGSRVVDADEPGAAGATAAERAAARHGTTVRVAEPEADELADDEGDDDELEDEYVDEDEAVEDDELEYDDDVEVEVDDDEAVEDEAVEDEAVPEAVEDEAVEDDVVEADEPEVLEETAPTPAADRPRTAAERAAARRARMRTQNDGKDA